MNKIVLITGGAGYVGSALVPSLLDSGYKVVVYDLYLFGNVFKEIKNKNLTEIKGDIRDKGKLLEAGKGVDYLIHLACISNDPSFELDPKLGKSINYDAFQNVIETVKSNNIKRIIFASSASIYGTQEGDVMENLKGVPLTDYAKFKLLCEEALKDSGLKNYVSVRPGTVNGYAPRLRLDLIINNFTIRALVNKKISFFGGWQLRPSININDMVRVYKLLIEAPDELVHEKAFNAGFQNATVEDMAKMVVKVFVERNIENRIQVEKLDVPDKRSYHLNSEKIKAELGFIPNFTIEDGILSIVEAFKKGLIADGLDNPIYHNTKMMKLTALK
ncbi:hypothetical protein A3F19_02795 [Candidatus Nomurabacteria bacterium RIFCSPHIGHO2_12_FULL_37_29]|uniref:NAD-dependent epimerase/dehydratase domain-containing protein n=2 Tax=Parcubacteria group TaxID=1794811 RepID=A0A1G2UNA1_9BACT|nr:MAG: hypothetical protein A3F19_02795 [Candidatus Nomurabacteria bacterium RIFCSPHIGHO2_12_FULL_37_29]OHB10886.1 MAG: hypothetical protein A3H60_02035 [Candidatus Zambryskibacteria bacterium RIFCSPLOWO2_02_FULL_44_12b]